MYTSTEFDLAIALMLIISTMLSVLYYFIQEPSSEKTIIYSSFIVFVFSSVLTTFRLQIIQPNEGLPLIYMLSQLIPFILCLTYAHKTQCLGLIIEEFGGAPDEID